MQQAISNLRLLLASVRAKDEELEALARQFKRQLERAPRYAIQGGNPLELTLNLMGEIQERLDNVEEQRKHLSAVRRQVETELVALNITEKIAQAKEELAQLRASRNAGENVDAGRVAELQRFIEEASLRAGEAITGGFNDERRQSGPIT
jgi:hypothetical protein